jgi:L-fucose isomerase-like protein
MKKLKVCFLAGFMDGFSTAGLKKFAEYQKELKKISDEMDFELMVLPTIVKSMSEAVKARRELDEKDIDFALLFHPSYIIGDFVYEMMKARAYFGLWAIEELSDEGPMPLASLVNVEQNASISINNFKGNAKKTKWFFGDITKKYFIDRFEITVKSLTAVKNLRDAKVAQIGKLADGHINHMTDPRQIYKNIGVDVSRDYEVEDIIRMSEEIDKEKVDKKISEITSSSEISRVSIQKIRDSVKMYLAIKKICDENDYSAVAFSCWPKLMPLKEMSGCLVNSLLNSDGIAAGCEADVLSTISMLVLSYLARDITAVMDLPKFDEKDDSVLLWHCGSAPFGMANKRGVICEKHYFADYEQSLKNCGPVTDMIFSENEVTVFRLTDESERFYYFTGRFFNEEKKSFCGSRGWVNDLKLYDEPIKSVDLINTVLVNGLAHHFPIVQKDVSKYLEEFGFWAGLKKIKRFDYKDYLYV